MEAILEKTTNVVKATNSYAVSDISKINDTFNQDLTVGNIESDSWAAENTNLKKYKGHKIIKFNDFEVSTRDELSELITG